MDIKGAIFDLDGTLLDSMTVWETAAADFLRSCGIPPKPDVREAVRAMSIQQVAEHFQTEYEMTQSVNDIVCSVNNFLEGFYSNRVELKDGVAEMLETLKHQNTKMCIATASDRLLVEAGLRRTGIAPYFSRIFTCTESGAGKDRPDIFMDALDHLGTNIKDTIVFEDALYAIRTAKNAGFTVVALYDESAQGHQEDIKSLADYHFPSFKAWNMRHTGTSNSAK